MITELRITGFKSFGISPQRLQLGPLNFVVGANASGKTNLINALRFLQLAVRENAEYAVAEFGGVGEVRNRILHERTSPKPMMISVQMVLDEGLRVEQASETREMTVSKFSYSLTIDLRDESGLPVVESEHVNGSLKGRDGKELDYELLRDRDEVVIRDSTGLASSKEQKVRVPPQESTRLALGVGFFSLPAVILRDLILNWRFYSISPERSRLPFKDTPDVDLGPRGENLSVVLHKIEQADGKGTLDSIVAGLRGAVPGFKEIRTIQLPVEGKWAFQVIEDRIKGSINPDSVSDGTIRLLALMVIAHWVARDSSLLIIEEPENGLHPHLSEYVVSILREATQQKRQIIVTTHNPAFLDYLEPQEIILCDKEEGFTKLRRASDVEQVDHFRKHFRLGELWVQGTLGGIP